jgi:hypothetical protein
MKNKILLIVNYAENIPSVEYAQSWAGKIKLTKIYFPIYYEGTELVAPLEFAVRNPKFHEHH